MPQKTSSSFFIIDGKCVLFRKRTNSLTDLFVTLQSYRTVFCFNQIVRAACIKPGHNTPLCSTAKRILHFIPVVKRDLFTHPDNWQKLKRRHIQTADPFQIILNLCFFIFQLCRIGKFHDLAASAAGCLRARRVYTVWRRRQNLQCLCIAISLFHLCNDRRYRIPDHGILNKKGIAFFLSYTFSVHAHIRDRKFYPVVFVHAIPSSVLLCSWISPMMSLTVVSSFIS